MTDREQTTADQLGNERWITRDYGGEGKGLSMSKDVLGRFVYELLRHGGSITSTYAMAQAPRSYVQFAIALPAGRREALQSVSGITLERPPTWKLA